MRKILVVLAIIAVALVVFIAIQPAEFRVTRTANIAAPAPAIFAEVNDFHHWEAWSPWARRDPSMKQTYEGAPAGLDAVYTWAGNREVGEGRMTIIESRLNELIRIKLEFLKPFAATNTAEFTFQPEANQTVVTWSMFGKKNFFSKAFGLVMSMDKMIGGDFEKGLASLKSVVEGRK